MQHVHDLGCLCTKYIGYIHGMKFAQKVFYTSSPNTNKIQHCRVCKSRVVLFNPILPSFFFQ